MPARAVDRPATVSIPVNAVIDDDIRPGHSANEPTTSPAPACRRRSTLARSRARVAMIPNENEERRARRAHARMPRRSDCTRSRDCRRAGARWSNRCPV
jgi:hypothetical protein